MPPAGMGDIPGVGALVAAGVADGAGTVLFTGAGVLLIGLFRIRPASARAFRFYW